MTAETLERPESERSTAEQSKLRASVGRLLSDESLDALNPYRDRLEPVERLKLFREFVRLRGRRYAKCELNSFIPVKGSSGVTDALRHFCDTMPARMQKSDGGLVLLGPAGTGKDHLLMGVMRHAIIEHGLRVRWFDGLQLFDEIKRRISDNSVSEFIAGLCRVQVLAISDPVPPRDLLSAYELSKLREIVDKRYSNGMATWVTTNVQTAEDARRLFTDAVLSRLLDGSLELFCGWDCYRRPFSA